MIAPEIPPNYEELSTLFTATSAGGVHVFDLGTIYSECPIVWDTIPPSPLHPTNKDLGKGWIINTKSRLEHVTLQVTVPPRPTYITEIKLEFLRSGVVVESLTETHFYGVRKHLFDGKFLEAKIAAMKFY